MQRAFLFSLIFHGGILAVAVYGLPYLETEPPLIEDAITVEILNVDEKTNAPEVVPEESKKPEQKKIKKTEPEKKPPPPPPPPKQASAPPPVPEHDVIAEKKAEPAPVQEKPKAKPKPKPIPKPEKIVPEKKAKPKVKAQIKAKAKFAKIKPRRKPKHRPQPPDQFQSVLKSLEKLKKSTPRKVDKDKSKEKPVKKAEKPAEKSTFAEQMAKALASPSKSYNAEQPLAISEIDLVRQQIRKCWSLPAGAKNAADLVITVIVDMNADGTVRQARIKDQARMGNDTFFRAAAESARRAVLNPRCSPFKLPREKYRQWQRMTLNFNPKEMF